jgi:glycosyltransferase involved in cell wall biosynthesis
MRVLIASRHRYPASVGGLSGCRLLDYLAKGLSELGHTVFCYLEGGAAIPLPPAINLVSEPVLDVDILHVQDTKLFRKLGAPDRKWIRTCHVDFELKGLDRASARSNWVFVSKTLAQTYGSDRYVLNGIDPAEFIYSEQKQDYFLFVCDLERAMSKGLDVALDLARRTGVKLVVAGSSWDCRLVEEIALMCDAVGADYQGEIWGTRKAALFAEAKAVLFPTKWNEGFGLVMAEALMSGTPVICSDQGACPEIISPDVGFICSSNADYLQAIERVTGISPRACREKAMREFHYLRMAADYVREYEKELGRGSSSEALADNAVRAAF